MALSSSGSSSSGGRGGASGGGRGRTFPTQAASPVTFGGFPYGYGGLAVTTPGQVDDLIIRAVFNRLFNFPFYGYFAESLPNQLTRPIELLPPPLRSRLDRTVVTRVGYDVLDRLSELLVTPPDAAPGELIPAGCIGPVFSFGVRGGNCSVSPDDGSVTCTQPSVRLTASPLTCNLPYRSGCVIDGVLYRKQVPLGPRSGGYLGPSPAVYQAGVGLNLTRVWLGFNLQARRLLQDFGLIRWYAYLVQFLSFELDRIAVALVAPNPPPGVRRVFIENNNPRGSGGGGGGSNQNGNTGRGSGGGENVGRGSGGTGSGGSFRNGSGDVSGSSISGSSGGGSGNVGRSNSGDGGSGGRVRSGGDSGGGSSSPASQREAVGGGRYVGEGESEGEGGGKAGGGPVSPASAAAAAAATASGAAATTSAPAAVPAAFPTAAAANAAATTEEAPAEIWAPNLNRTGRMYPPAAGAEGALTPDGPDSTSGDAGGGASSLGANLMSLASQLSAWRGNPNLMRLLSAQLLDGRSDQAEPDGAAAAAAAATRRHRPAPPPQPGGGSDQFAQGTLGGTFNMRGDSPEALVGQPERDAQGRRVTRGSAQEDAALADLERQLRQQMDAAAVLSRAGDASMAAAAAAGRSGRGRDAAGRDLGLPKAAAGGDGGGGSPAPAAAAAAAASGGVGSNSGGGVNGGSGGRGAEPAALNPLASALLRAMGISTDQVLVGSTSQKTEGRDEGGGADKASLGGPAGGRQPGGAREPGAGQSSEGDLLGLLRSAAGRALAGEDSGEGGWEALVAQQGQGQGQQGRLQGFAGDGGAASLAGAGMQGAKGSDGGGGSSREGASDADLMEWLLGDY
ncbi:hypothetical protein PLESTB_000185800 [Pleodorina starrii]|uniref:Uncharacterized protein n=1 Tax=Pleodorina starrii TaxID=330485 RepID=A0A9W6BCQ2_9CHLO|nr:hypothetical protein PLESTB_000185800 [Pleodorina starrii]